MTYPGIDYSHGNPQVNRGPTGISYGLLSIHNPHLHEWFWESVESVYVPTCPHCGGELPTSWEEDYPCVHCNRMIPWGACYGDEPDGHILVDDQIDGFVSDGNIWVTNSPYYTRAQYCSPCMPGAGNLDVECGEGPKTYCLGHEWFKEGAPYTVYRVEDDAPIEKGH